MEEEQGVINRKQGVNFKAVSETEMSVYSFFFISLKSRARRHFTELGATDFLEQMLSWVRWFPKSYPRRLYLHTSHACVWLNECVPDRTRFAIDIEILGDIFRGRSRSRIALK